MNDRLKAILEELPEKPPRSRLEPYKELIEELRRRGRTYKDIAALFSEKFSIRVTAAGVHDFVRRRRPATTKPRLDWMAERITGSLRSIPAAAADTAIPQATQPFTFDPDEPLRLTKLTKP